jgi:ABC-type sugar transport system ATPase subunit
MHLVSRLEVKNVTMEFPAVRALSGVSLAFEPGEVHGIVGENGAGKSTLMKILGGLQRPTFGEILLNGSPVELSGVRRAQSLGIAMIHQELNLVDELSVAENVFLGREPTKFDVIDRKRLAVETDRLLKQVHASFSANTKVESLSLAEKQLVEIAKAVSVNASILIMDEPTAVLSDPEAQSLFRLISVLREQGVTVLYISHRLPEVCAICDRISVLRDGEWITTLDAKNASPAALADLMVGRTLGDFYPPKVPVPDTVSILETRNVRGVSLSVRPGEILGLAGLVGAGRTELAEAIVGLRSAEGGEVRIDGAKIRIRSPKQAMRHGIAYLSEDRKKLGLHVSLDLVQNVTLANLRRYGAVVLNQRKELKSAEAWQADLNIRAGDLRGAVRNVSGGNQQKIAIAKWLETKPKVLILDEPTRGVDVGAKREMYNLIQRLAADGMACIVISSDLPEILGLCHRALVLREGKVAGELQGSELSEEAVMRLAAGVLAA